MRVLVAIICLGIINFCIYADSQKTALIFGITGQDGLYLTQLLLEKGYRVVGVCRAKRTSNEYNYNFLRSMNEIELRHGDLTDAESIKTIIDEIQPDEIYNLAAQSHVGASYESAEYTAETDALGALRILEAMRRMNKLCRYYQASSSEMFGKVTQIPQNEYTPFNPRSPYGVAKLYAYWITRNYREIYGMYACNGILYNHESPFRADNFVSRKITKAVVNIALGNQEILYLGNIHAKRDWGFAQDYVYSMWLMLQQDSPDDYVIGTGHTHSVKEFVELAFQEMGIDIEWQGTGVSEKGINTANRKIVVAIDPAYFRPVDVESLVADTWRAEKKLNWKPQTDFNELVKIMVQADYALLTQE